MMKKPEEDVNICFKKADKKRLSGETKRVNGVLKYIKTRNISETNRLMKVISVYIADKLGMKRGNSTRKNEIPRWKRRLENDIKQLRYAISMFERKKNGLIRKQAKVISVYIADKLGMKRGNSTRKNEIPRWKRRLENDIKQLRYAISMFERKKNGLIRKQVKVISVYIADKLGMKRGNSTRKNEIPRWKRRLENDIKQLRYAISMFERKKNGLIRKQAKVKALEKKYKTGNKDIEVIIEELKQRVKAKKAKISRYDKRILQFRQNRLFATDQKKFYNEINGEFRKDKIVPDAKESKEFWEGIWSEPKNIKKMLNG